MNYFDTFIAVAPDCAASKAKIPPLRGENPSIAEIHYELIADNPYRYTQEDVLWRTHARRKELLLGDKQERERFFSRSQACLRSSQLAKRYGWGFHFDAGGKVALVAIESEEYAAFLGGAKRGARVVAALRSRRG